MWFSLTSTTKIFWESSKNCTFKCSILGEAVRLRAGSASCGCCDRKGLSPAVSLPAGCCALRSPHPQAGIPTFGGAQCHLREVMHTRGRLCAECWVPQHLGSLRRGQQQNQLNFHLGSFLRRNRRERKCLRLLGIVFISQVHNLETLHEPLKNWETTFSKVKRLVRIL